MIETSHTQDATRKILLELGIPVHQDGYIQLCIGIPHFALDPRQSLSKELYPYIAAQFGGVSPEDVESSTRRAIKNAWNRRDPDVWEKYFPRLHKAPSNLVFIATVTEHLRKL